MSRVGEAGGIPFTGVHLPLWRNPKRQQIIIFKPPFDPTQPDYVKRAVGLPGDTIDIRDNAVWINGKKLLQDYTLGKTERVENSDINMPYQVPDNCYFAMGDNPQNSYDSRFLGFVPPNEIILTPASIYITLTPPPNPWPPA